jgi:hypothetical protein
MNGQKRPDSDATSGVRWADFGVDHQQRDLPPWTFRGIATQQVVGFQSDFFPGAGYGAILSGCFTLRRYLHAAWKAIAITAACSLAYFFSFVAAVEVSLHPFGLVPDDRRGEVTDPALVAGGLTEAFCIVCVVSLLLNSRLTWQRRILKALCWTPVGAVLAVVGWALGPSIGIALWQMVHSMNLTAPTETLQNTPKASQVTCFPGGPYGRPEWVLYWVWL